MNELELLERLIPGLPTDPSVRVGAGDDCAVLDAGIPDHWLLFKTDAVVEGVHFTREIDPKRTGHKALARCLSDIAAMAGTPTHALVTLGLPEDYDPNFVQRLYSGINELAKRHGVSIAGGEITLNPGHIFVSVTVLGRVSQDRSILRSGAKVGDAIFVTGDLGGSMEGKHLDFEPRLREARWLAEHFPIHAMIDLSDGLARDLRHVLKASGLGAELLASAIPISRAAKRRARAKFLEGVEVPAVELLRLALPAALADGEDFELLFTVAARDAVPLLDAWKQEFPELALSCVGKMIERSGLFMRDQRGVRALELDGYVHFS